MPRKRDSYRPAEVERLVTRYHETRARIDTTSRGLRELVRIADLDRAMRFLPLSLKGPVVLHGMLGLSQDAAGELLQISQQQVGKRYRYGLEELHFHMNGGIT